MRFKLPFALLLTAGCASEPVGLDPPGPIDGGPPQVDLGPPDAGPEPMDMGVEDMSAPDAETLLPCTPDIEVPSINLPSTEVFGPARLTTADGAFHLAMQISATFNMPGAQPLETSVAQFYRFNARANVFSTIESSDNPITNLNAVLGTENQTIAVFEGPARSGGSDGVGVELIPAQIGVPSYFWISPRANVSLLASTQTSSAVLTLQGRVQDDLVTTIQLWEFPFEGGIDQLADESLDRGVHAPRLTTTEGALWLSYIEEDLLTLVVTRRSLEDGQTLEQFSLPGCGGRRHQVTNANGQLAIALECPNEARLIVFDPSGDFVHVPITGQPIAEPRTRIAHKNGGLAVVVWGSGEPTPDVHFFTAEGERTVDRVYRPQLSFTGARTGFDFAALEAANGLPGFWGLVMTAQDSDLQSHRMIQFSDCTF